MITESLGRTTVYLGTLYATLVALALIIQGETTEDDDRDDDHHRPGGPLL